MYSPRRGSYKYRSSQYYKKKRINRKFSPALYKAPIPSYFQQKGRIIQTSPARIPIVPRFLPNRETLDDMYNTLIQANYPNVGPSSSFQYDGWYYHIFSAPLSEIFTFPSSTPYTSYPVNTQWLKQYLDSLVERPPLPEGFDIEGNIMQLHYSIPAGSSTSRFTLTYNTDLYADPIYLISKSTDSTFTDPTYNNLLYLQNDTSDDVIYAKLEFGPDSAYIYQDQFTPNSSISIDDSYLPFISTSDNNNRKQLVATRSNTSDIPYGNISFLIVYKYIESL